MTYVNVGIVICIIFAIVGYLSEKKLWMNPITIFCGLWAVILYFSSKQNYTMYMASDEKNLFILIGIIAFIGGYYINKVFFQRIHLRIGRYSRYYEDTHYETIPRYKLLYALCWICLLYTLFTLVNVIRQSGTFNLGTIQKMLQSGDIVSGNSSIINAIAILIISPVKFVLPAITAVDFWFGRRDRKLLYMTLGLAIINMLSSANRTSFLLFFVWLFIVGKLFLYQNNRKRSDFYNKLLNNHLIAKIKKYMSILVIVGIVAFVLMTISRGSSSILKQLYLYFSMPPSMFEIWSQKIEAENVYGYGIASLLGFIYPICYVFKNLLGFPMPQIVQSIYDWTVLTDTLWVWPGKNIKANAYVSLFWFLYLDGRIVGIVIGMLILGIVTSRSFFAVCSKRYSARQVALYCCIFYIILFSYVRLQFSLSRVALGILFVMFVAYKVSPIEAEGE